jgi:plastocyanin
MTKSLKAGDHVAWNTSQGETHGVVVKKVNSTTHIKGHKVAASKDNPEYIVKSDKSGDKAAHKGSALKTR